MFGGTDPASLNGGPGNPVFGSKNIGSAPSIRPTDDQCRELFEALTSRKSLRMEVGTKVSPYSAATPLPFRVAPSLGLPFEPMRLLDHVPAAATESPVVEYLRIDSFTGVAAVVAPGTAKPELSMASSLVDLVISKIAAFIRLVDEVPLDYSGFLSFVDQELTTAVIDCENDELLNGLAGINTITGTLTRTQGVDTSLDCVEQAIADIRVGPAFAAVDLIVANPSDFSKLRRSKDTQGRYLLNPDPSAKEATSLWGIPVVLTTKQPLGKLVVGAFQATTQAWVRSGITLEANSSGADWVGNITALRCEERVGLAVTRPAGLCKVTLS